MKSNPITQFTFTYFPTINDVADEALSLLSFLNDQATTVMQLNRITGTKNNATKRCRY